MYLPTKAEAVVVRHRLIKDVPHNGLFVEVDDLQGQPVAAFNDPKGAAEWLTHAGFIYVEGTSGVWSRSKKKTDGSILSGLGISLATHSQPDKTHKKSWKQYAINALDILGIVSIFCLILLGFWVLTD